MSERDDLAKLLNSIERAHRWNFFLAVFWAIAFLLVLPWVGMCLMLYCEWVGSWFK